MRVVLFCQSLVSSWDHGAAHFLRGVTGELCARGHQIAVFEPANGWSRRHLIATQGEGALSRFHEAFPDLTSIDYDPDRLDLDRALDGADLVIVHAWTDPGLIARIGRHRLRARSYRLLFHDTHHRALTDPERIDLASFDGALVAGESLASLYRARGITERVWVWHEAADTRVFFPRPPAPDRRDVVWIGNWGPGDRSHQVRRLFIAPVRALGLRAAAYGVRYPAAARRRLQSAGIEACGWVPNYRVPCVMAEFVATVHIPRPPYVAQLPGIPTIRMFESLACGIPTVSAPWLDLEGLFSPGEDFLIAHTPGEMTAQLRAVLGDRDLARSLSDHGRAAILARHTCAHRVTELMAIVGQLA